MELKDIKEKIKVLFSKQFNMQEISETENYFDGVVANSIDALALLIEIENEFKIYIDEDDLNANLIKSVDNISEYVYKKLEEKLGEMQ